MLLYTQIVLYNVCVLQKKFYFDLNTSKQNVKEIKATIAFAKISNHYRVIDVHYH